MTSSEVRVGGNYKVGRRIGHGSFGEIYRGVDVLTGTHVAIKVESLRKRNPHLLHESKLYRQLQGVRGVPHIYWYGVEGEFSVLVMDLLGPSIEDLFERAHQQFSLKTSVMLTHQMISRLELVHAQGIIHRDIKPHNFTIGRYDHSIAEDVTKLIYVIDFGLSKKYRDGKHAHMQYRDGKNLTGTARYVSINTHLGVEPSRRDDLESCVYVLLYLMRGGLPWQGLRAATKKEKYEKIMEKKIGTAIESLCDGYPKEICECLAYCRSLRFSEKPDYCYVKSKLSAVLLRRNLSLDNIFDWNSPSFPSNSADVKPVESRLAEREHPPTCEESGQRDTVMVAATDWTVRPNEIGKQSYEPPLDVEMNDVYDQRKHSDTQDLYVEERRRGLTRLTSTMGPSRSSRLSFVKPKQMTPATSQQVIEECSPERGSLSPKSNLAWSAASAMVAYFGLRKKKSRQSGDLRDDDEHPSSLVVETNDYDRRLSDHDQKLTSASHRMVKKSMVL